MTFANRAEAGERGDDDEPEQAHRLSEEAPSRCAIATLTAVSAGGFTSLVPRGFADR